MASPEAKKIRADTEEAVEDEGDQIMPALAEADAIQAQLAVVSEPRPGTRQQLPCQGRAGLCHPPCGSRPARLHSAHVQSRCLGAECHIEYGLPALEARLVVLGPSAAGHLTPSPSSSECPAAAGSPAFRSATTCMPLCHALQT